MALKAGSPSKYSGSMAEAIEKAFLAAWPAVIPDQPAPVFTNQTKLLFIAIAQGVVGHLAAHPEAFKIAVAPDAGHTHSATITAIEQ